MDVFEIRLENVLIHAFHGVAEQENIVGGEFRVDVTVSLPLPDGEIADDLADTVSYAGLYAVVKEEMSVRSALIEHVADKICRRIGKENPIVKSAEIRIAKIAPPISGMDGSASVCVKRFFGKNIEENLRGKK